VGLLVLGLVVPRWWTTGAAMGITILLWVYDATQVHPQLESSLKVWCGLSPVRPQVLRLGRACSCGD
jgi:hypothetical protein